MALSQIVRKDCEHCGKVAVEVKRSKIGKTTFIKLACGHTITQAVTETDENVYSNITFSDGARPRAYQVEAMQFAERANFKCIIADEQGLGKTIEVLCLLRVHYAKILPAVIVVPTTVKPQWMWEIYRICSTNGVKDPKFLTQVIQNGKERAIPGFQVYIITYDMLKNDDIFSLLPDGYVKTLIIDECHRIKNHLSERAKAVQRFRRKVEYCMPMGGTPIKNNAGEYFTVLNLVDYLKFPQYQKFLDGYCDYYNNGWANKVGGLKDAARFHEDTKDLIIRRKKDQVLKDLPAKERKFHHVELDRKLNKAYAQALQELDDLLYNDNGMSGFAQGAAKIAIMSRMRHITGVSKVTECVDFTQTFLENCDRKLVIFTHHTDVAQLVIDKLNKWFVEENGDKNYGKVCHLHSGLDSNARADIAKQFKEDPTRRVMVASTLAAGEGINLQFCSDAILLERQWNPGNEEQAEDRFHRFGQMNNVSITYMIASGTIDELFTELVEIKRGIVASTVDNKQIEWNEQGLMSELAQILVTRGRDKWTL